MISEAYKKEFVKRFKSFLWRTLDMIISGLIAFILTEVNLLSMPIEVVALIGLIFGELSKFLLVNFPKLREAEEKLPNV